MLTVRIQEKNYSESIMVLKLKDGKMYFACRPAAAFFHEAGVFPGRAWLNRNKRFGVLCKIAFEKTEKNIIIYYITCSIYCVSPVYAARFLFQIWRYRR